MLKPPSMPPARPPQTVEQFLTLIRDEWDLLFRATAGYGTLITVLNQISGAGPQRKRGMPILTHKATFDGTDCVEVSCDLGKISPQFIPGILSPICNVYATEMLGSATRIHGAIEKVIAMIAEALGPNAPSLIERPVSEEEPANEIEEEQDG